MAAICLDFKWLGFQVLDPIQNLDHLQPNLFLTIQNPDYSIFHIPTGPNTWNLDSSEIPNKSAVQISLFGMFAIQIPTALIFLMIFKMVLASQNF